MSTFILHLLLFLLQLILLLTILLRPARRRLVNILRHHLTAATADVVHNSYPPPPPLLDPKYDAFISFRGDDVRDTFLSHLYTNLNDRKKISTYMDSVDLTRGEQISDSLRNAIEASRVYVVIFSPNYAESEWCLEELVMVLECSRRYGGRKVIPVFYGGVYPCDVRLQTGRYGLGKKKNHHKVANWEEKVGMWRAALTEASTISGFDSQVTRPESKLIEEVSKAVLEGIQNRNTTLISHFKKGLIGVNERMQEIEPLFSPKAHENQTLGLWGMGGIGKTTLARSIFEHFSSQFEASIFIENFTDQLSRTDAFSMQHQLLSSLLGDEMINNTHQYRRLRHKRVFIVVDDVGNDIGNIGPLDDLLKGEMCGLFGPGSRIILTSRNKQLLENLCHNVHEVKGLNDSEALELFNFHAFKKEDSSLGYRFSELSWRAVYYLGGNPLAIRIMGSHLYGRDEGFWVRELDALRSNNHYPTRVVENVLKRSYDGLSKVEKNVFLDIACFYSKWDGNILGRFEEIVLEGCYGGSKNLVTNLVDKSLVTIIDGNYQYSSIGMHRLLEDLARGMVNEECRVGKRSRLWRAKDIFHLFKQNKGTETVEGIVWDVSEIKYEAKEIQIMADTFMNMENLRVLVIYYMRGDWMQPKLTIPENGLICLPDSLNCLCWESFPSKSLPTDFSSQNLVTLDLTNSNIQQLWDPRHQFVDLGNLKSLTLAGCIYLTNLPDLSSAQKLQRIDLSCCQSLTELPVSILHLPNLEEILLWYCISLQLHNLERYTKTTTETTTNLLLPSLKKISLTGTRIKTIPNFILRLRISELYCLDCPTMTEFPVIPTLTVLSLGKTMIKEVELLHLLKELCLTSNNHLTNLPTEIHKLRFVERIDVSKCRQLKEFPEILEPMGAMEELDLSGCCSLKVLPCSISNLLFLQRLYVSGTAIEELPSSVVDLFELARLDVSGCCELARLPELPSSLMYLDAYGCELLETIEMVGKHNLVESRWRLGGCSKLDRNTSIDVISQFIYPVMDGARSYYGRTPLVIVPEESVDWAECLLGGQSSSGDSVTVVNLRCPWKLKGVIYWAHLDSTLLTLDKALYSVECNWESCNDDDDDDDDDRYEYEHIGPCFSSCLVRDVSPGEQLSGVFLWYDGLNYKYKRMAEGKYKIKFSVSAAEMVRGFWKETELPNFIRSCGVSLLYDDNDDNDDDDDDGLEEMDVEDTDDDYEQVEGVEDVDDHNHQVYQWEGHTGEEEEDDDGSI